MKQDTSCITLESYNLLRESPYSEVLSKYQLVKEVQKIRFTTKKGYTLFYIKLETKDRNVEITLVGLDGYGMRDNEFQRYICRLVAKVRKESNNK